MTIHLPDEVEREIIAEVDRGHFVSVDDALAEAWRSFKRHRVALVPTPGQGLIGACATTRSCSTRPSSTR